jgi:hypothetical protein
MDGCGLRRRNAVVSPVEFAREDSHTSAMPVDMRVAASYATAPCRRLTKLHFRAD